MTTQTIRRGFKYRLNPTPAQEQQFRQHGGNTRFVWNLMLELNINTYQSNGKFVFYHDMWKSMKVFKEEDHPFLNESSCQSMQQTLKQLDRALNDCFKNGNGFPRYKAKQKSQDSFMIPQHFKISKGRIYIPKIGWIPWIKHRNMQGVPKNVTVKQDGKHWYASVQCEYKKDVEYPEKDESLNLVGIDLGLKEFCVMSNGQIINNPRHIRQHEHKLTKEQRRLSRKQKGSKNRRRQQTKVQDSHRSVRQAREDFLHKVTDSIAKNPKIGGVVVEDLNVAGMSKNHCLAKAILDAGWSKFNRFLKYKLEERGKYYIKIGRFEPSSKTCSCCSHVQDMPLNKRTYKCPECGLKMDRDLNAAKNIANLGYKMLCTPGQGGFDGCLRPPTDGKRSPVIQQKESVDNYTEVPAFRRGE